MVERDGCLMINSLPRLLSKRYLPRLPANPSWSSAWRTFSEKGGLSILTNGFFGAKAMHFGKFSLLFSEPRSRKNFQVYISWLLRNVFWRNLSFALFRFCHACPMET